MRVAQLGDPGQGGVQGTWAEVVRQLEAKQRLAEVVSEALQRFQAAECLRLQHQPHSPPQEALVAQAQHAAAIEAFTSFLRVRPVKYFIRRISSPAACG